MRLLDLSTTLRFPLGWNCNNDLGPAYAVNHISFPHLSEFYIVVAKLKGKLNLCEDPLARCDFVEISRLEPQFERANIQVSSMTKFEAFDHLEFEEIAGK